MKKEMNYESYAYMFVAGIAGLYFSRFDTSLITPSIFISGSSVVLSILDYYTKNKRNNMWQTLGIINNDGNFPRLINKRKVKDEIEYIYFIPEGLSKKQILSKKDEIENIFKSYIEVELLDDFNIKIITGKPKPI